MWVNEVMFTAFLAPSRCSRDAGYHFMCVQMISLHLDVSEFPLLFFTIEFTSCSGQVRTLISASSVHGGCLF